MFVVAKNLLGARYVAGCSFYVDVVGTKVDRDV
jgi:hypothetical protein